MGDSLVYQVECDEFLFARVHISYIFINEKNMENEKVNLWLVSATYVKSSRQILLI